MCIRLHLHRMPCDVRHFLTLAKPTHQGRICIQYTNPYSDPLRCPHRPVRNSCRWNGCCKHTVADLPCSCADAFPWGREGPSEDLTQCLHYREYHEYEFQINPELAGPIDSDEPAWEAFRYLDEWVTVDRDIQPELYCHSQQWWEGVQELMRSGKRLREVVTTTEGWRDPELLVDAETMGSMERDVTAAWDQQRGVQRRLRIMDERRADALLGWNVEGEGIPAHEGGAGKFI